tara:strand:+ start:214 stop:543 length:330 start_codon:yes stop_codon:yes gene_type:complete
VSPLGAFLRREEHHRDASFDGLVDDARRRASDELAGNHDHVEETLLGNGVPPTTDTVCPSLPVSSGIFQEVVSTSSDSDANVLACCFGLLDKLLPNLLRFLGQDVGIHR